MTVLIPDVSEFQAGASAPDWAGIKTVNGGAGICRVGYGDAHLDAMFVSNYTAMKTHGFTFIGLYQYLRQDQDVTAQANAFCSWIGPPSAVAPGTVFILDLEEGGGDQSTRAGTWHTVVDNYFGLVAQPLPLRSWLYSYTFFIGTHNLTSIFMSNRRTWIAAYSSLEPSLGHTLWQCTDGTSGSHITDWPGCGRTDTSLYHGTLPQLAALGWPAPVTPPTLNWTEQLVQTLPTIAQGSTGEDVKTAQGLLVARNHPVTVDGVFGPGTDSAVRSFQSASGLAADGIIGQQTWTKLLHR